MKLRCIVYIPHFREEARLSDMALLANTTFAYWTNIEVEIFIWEFVLGTNYKTTRVWPGKKADHASKAWKEILCINSYVLCWEIFEFWALFQIEGQRSIYKQAVNAIKYPFIPCVTLQHLEYHDSLFVSLFEVMKHKETKERSDF